MSASPPELPAPPDGAAVDAYVAELARRLRVGPGDAAGQDLLDEAADHLHSHAEDLVSKGVAADAATAAALADFGSPDDIVPRLRAELLRPHLRRLSAVLLMLGLLLGVGWTVLFELSPPVPWTPAERPPLSLAFDEGAELFAATALLLATVSLALLVLPGRVKLLARWRAMGQRWSARAAAASLMLGAAAAVQTFGYLVIRAVIGAHSLSWPAVTLATLVTLAGAGVLAPPLRAIGGRYLGGVARERTSPSPE